MPAAPRVELFHRVADTGSAEVRRYVTEHELEEWVRFRNVHSPEVQAELEAHGGVSVPALWDGERLFQGAQACIARLASLLDVGRAP